MQAIEQRYYTPEEYLSLEQQADVKHAYLNGQIVPMAGGTTNHNRIALNFSIALDRVLGEENYEIFISDIRLWIPDYRIYTYPDVMLIAGATQYWNNRTDTILNPQVIIEVLSDSTGGYDREGKFEVYRSIPSFQEYVLVSQTKIQVEQFSRTGKKRWELREYDAEDEAIELNTIPFQLNLEELYRRVKFDAGKPEESSR